MNTRVSAKEAALGDEPAASMAYYKKMYDRVSELGQIGVWECDLATEQLAWTNAVYDLFELPHGTPLDRGAIVQMYEPETRARLEDVRAEAIRRGTGFALDAQIKTGKGNMRWIRITADIELEEGRPVRIFGTKQDVTREHAVKNELRWLQNELIHVSRVNAMSAMASTLAHELNQPLTAIANYLVAARRMADQLPAAGDVSFCVESARASALRAGEIIRRLREMTVRGQTRRERFDLAGAITEAVALATTGHPKLRVSCQIEPGTELVGDRIQIQQVLLNLIQNSFEASGGAACRIQISVSERNGEIDLRVSDDGPGVSQEILPKIFDSLVTTKPEGMGIGLSVSRTIVEMHGGRISVCNAAERGTCICIVLPVDAAEATDKPRGCC